MSYGNYNGLHISRIVSPENIASVRVSQGAGAIGTQSTNNLGGTIETFSLQPLDHFAVQGNATYGSDQTIRGFVRVNVGSPDGFRAFLSYGYGSTDKYKGTGQQDQHMINAKGVLPVGEGLLDGWFSYSDRREQDYQDMSLDMLNRLGYGSDNTFPDYGLAVQLADVANNIDNVNNTTGAAGPDGKSDITGLAPSNPAAGKVFPGKYTSLDDAYFDASGLRKDTVGALGYKTPLAENANFQIKGYYHHNEGMGLWATPYVPSPTGAPISIRTTEYDIKRWASSVRPMAPSASTMSRSAVGTSISSSTRRAVSMRWKAAPIPAARSATIRPILSSPSGTSTITRIRRNIMSKTRSTSARSRSTSAGRAIRSRTAPSRSSRMSIRKASSRPRTGSSRMSARC